VHSLAEGCGIEVPQAMARRYSKDFNTFLIRRFDRDDEGARLHFASAMTLTGRTDGDDHATGASYLEIARVLMAHGARTAADLEQLWTRIVFNMLVSNVDDHLRNHGCMLEPGKGWRLSPAYDMNPAPDADGLKLNVSETDNAQDLDLALSVAHYFRLKPQKARDIVDRCRHVVRQWPKLAAALRLSQREQEQMERAFRLAA
jgi:serine/threonine-protein kinase HipA